MNAQVDEATLAEAPVETAPAKAPKKEIFTETVTMTDGRKVVFTGAPNAPRSRKLLKDYFINSEKGEVSVLLDFRNGQTRTFIIPQSLILQFAGHGAEQKLGDETAGLDDVDDMVFEVDALIERLNKGEFNKTREGSGATPGSSILVKAIMEASGRTMEQVKAFLATKSAKDKLNLRTQSPKIAPIVKRLEAEKAAKLTAGGTSVEDMEAELAAMS